MNIHRLLRKVGIGELIAPALMIFFGVLIFLYPNSLNFLVASYLILVGTVKLITKIKGA